VKIIKESRFNTFFE